jgi:pimeloyl-ACP methyl ester carboxylesterase
MSYADVNGISLHYEEHGSGQPLILLHGGYATGESYAAILPLLASGRRVITVDLQGHGRTADVDRPMRFQTLGDDIAALIRHLGLTSGFQADVMGYSFGAGTALRTAIQHPDLVRRLVVVSHPVRHDGWFPQSLAGFDQMGPAFAEVMKQSPLYEAYARVAPQVEDWPVLVDKMGTMLREDYDWSAEVAKVTAPVMLAYGDADSVWPAHIAEFYALLGGGLRDANWDGSARPVARLAILPGHTHYDIFMSPDLTSAVIPFLDAPPTSPSPFTEPPAPMGP